MCTGILFFSSATTFMYFFGVYINIGIPVFFICGSFCYFSWSLFFRSLEITDAGQVKLNLSS